MSENKDTVDQLNRLCMTWGRVREHLADGKCIVGIVIGLALGLSLALVLPWMAGKFGVLNRSTVVSTILGVAAGGLISVLASLLFGYVFYYKSGRQLDRRAEELGYLTQLIMQFLNSSVPPDLQPKFHRGPDGRMTLVVKAKGEVHSITTATGEGKPIVAPPQPPPVYDRQDQQPDTGDATP
jgi:hypothetical protein